MRNPIRTSLKHTLLVTGGFFKKNFDELEVYSKDFLFGIISKLITYFAEIFALFYIFDFVENINGWTLEQVLFMYSLNQIGFSLWACFFINTITLPYYIQDGTLDRFLLRPMSPIFQIMMDGFDDDSWGDLLMGLILLIYAWFSLKINFWYILLMPIICISACMIYASISLSLSTVSFFTIAPADVANFVNEIQEFAKYPTSIYPKVIRIIFTVIFPVVFVAFVPSLVLFNKVNVVWIVLLPIISFTFYKLSKHIWYWGLTHYAGTGT